jgi:hypothetical protein
VAKGLGIDVDDGAVALAPGGRGPNVGGACISRGSVAVAVFDIVGGAGTVFQACMDMDNDRVCRDGGPPGNPCPDTVIYSHADSPGFPAPGPNSNPMLLPAPVIPGCPGNLNDWIIIVCTGIHNDATGPHVHASSGGSIVPTAGGAAGFAAVPGGFCAPGGAPVLGGKPYVQL